MTDKKKAAHESSPESSQANNNTAYALIGAVHNTLSRASFVGTSSSAQSNAVATYCDRLDTLFANIEEHSDESFCDEMNAILATAVLIVKGCKAGQIQILKWQGVRP